MHFSVQEQKDKFRGGRACTVGVRRRIVVGVSETTERVSSRATLSIMLGNHGRYGRLWSLSSVLLLLLLLLWFLLLLSPFLSFLLLFLNTPLVFDVGDIELQDVCSAVEEGSDRWDRAS